MKRAAGLVVLTALLASVPAQAQRRAGRDSSRFAVFNALPFLAADIVYATRPGWAAPGWSIPELLHGSIYVSVMVANATGDIEALHASAWWWGVLGWGMLIHGTLSLVLWKLPGTERTQRVSWQVGPGGVALTGSF